MKEKTLDNTSMTNISNKIPDLKIHGDPGAWECICKASTKSEGWMKSTKRMKLENGYLYQVSTQQKNSDGTYTIAEALTFVPM